MTQIGIQAETGLEFDIDPAVNIWHEIIKVPEVAIKKLGEIVLGQE